MLRFGQETFVAIMAELPQLFCEHFDEVLSHETFDVDPDWKRYIALSDAGVLTIVTARFRSKLVGYCFIFIQPHTHYKHMRAAYIDLIYLQPRYRKGLAGAKLLSMAETISKDAGAVRIHLDLPAEAGLDILAKRLRYTLRERGYSKDL